MKKISEYLSKIDRSILQSQTVVLHLFNPYTCQHLVFFDFFNEEDDGSDDEEAILARSKELTCCCILSSPSLLGLGLPYTELSTIFLQDIDTVFSDYDIIDNHNSLYVGKDYRIVQQIFEKWQEQLLSF